MAKLYDENGNEVTKEQIAQEIYNEQFAAHEAQATWFKAARAVLSENGIKEDDPDYTTAVKGRRFGSLSEFENLAKEIASNRKGEKPSARDDIGILHPSKDERAAEPKKKATLDDADDIGDAVSKLFASGKKKSNSLID